MELPVALGADDNPVSFSVAAPFLLGSGEVDVLSSPL